MSCCVLALSLFSAPSLLMAAEQAIASSKLECLSSIPEAIENASPAKNQARLFESITQYLGIRYRFGGESPAGFDCSGFVRFMFGKELNIKLPHSSSAMATMGTRIDRSELRPGDLVFFKNSGNRINHVGIFIGNGTFVHSSLSKGITHNTLNERYYNERYATAVRLIDGLIWLETAPQELAPRSCTAEEENATS